MPSTNDVNDVRAELEREEQLDLVDPLRHFLAIDDEVSSSSSRSTIVKGSGDIRDLPSANDYSIVPQQLESIIDRRTIIRYYSDLSRQPELLTEEEECGKEKEKEDGARKEWWDVHLKLDMTTGCGGKIWPAAEVLGAYIAGKYSNPSHGQEKAEAEANKGYNKHNFDWRNKRIIELGSGTGLVGYLVHALSLSGCQIWVTDQDVMLPLMRENLLLNFPPVPSSPNNNNNNKNNSNNNDNNGLISVAELDWSTSPAPLFTTPCLPHVLLLADCVYLESAFQPLIDTMVALSTSETEILFCYQKRRKADKRFFAMLKKSFVFQDVEDDDETRMKEYRRQGTQLLRIRKK